MIMNNTDKFHVIDKIPFKYNEGPFWGNGYLGSLAYINGMALRFTLDNVQLWELRDGTQGMLASDYNTMKHNRHRNDFWNVERAEPYFPTRLPALSFDFPLETEVDRFHSKTNLETAETKISLSFTDKNSCNITVFMDSNLNVLCIGIKDKDGLFPEPVLNGWDYSKSNLALLKQWGYGDSVQENGQAFRHLFQPFGGENVAVMSMLVKKNRFTVQYYFTLSTAEKTNTDKVKSSNENQLLSYSQQCGRNLNKHRQSWLDFWRNFKVEVPDGELQKAFRLEMHKLYCNARESSLPMTLQGIWNHEGRLPAWCGDLHNDLNVQTCYWSAFKTGNAALAYPYIRTYSDAIPHFEWRAAKLTGVRDAVQVPTTMTPEGTGTGAEFRSWNTFLGPELYAGIDFCWYYEYTKDLDALKNRIYPYLRKTANLYMGVADEGADGKMHITFTHSPEYWNDEINGVLIGEDATFIISSLRYILQKLCEYAAVLGNNEESVWSDFLHRLVSSPVSEKGFQIVRGTDLEKSHRHFSHLFAIYPLGVLDRNNPEDNKLMQLCLDVVCRYGYTGFAAFSFPYLSILAARCGRGNMARLLLKIYCTCFRSKNSFTMNGDVLETGVLCPSKNSAGEPGDVFTLEAGLIVPAALCEMMVFRSCGSLHVLAGIPEDWRNCACSGLTVEGGHKISIVMQNALLEKLEIIPNVDDELQIVFRKAEGGYLCTNGENSELLGLSDGKVYPARLKKGEKLCVIKHNK